MKFLINFYDQYLPSWFQNQSPATGAYVILLNNKTFKIIAINFLPFFKTKRGYFSGDNILNSSNASIK